MNYNFTIRRGRSSFNLNFSARDDKQAIAEAKGLIKNFADLRWVLWYCPPRGRKWRKGIENDAKKSSARRVAKSKRT
jgi:hypothetical protein